MNELLSQAKAQQIPHHFPLSDDTLAETIIQPHFLSEAVFAGGTDFFCLHLSHILPFLLLSIIKTWPSQVVSGILKLLLVVFMESSKLLQVTVEEPGKNPRTVR